MRGSCSYSVSCSQLTQRMCHPCSWAGNRGIGVPWSGQPVAARCSWACAVPTITWSLTFPRRFRGRPFRHRRRGAHRAVPHRKFLRTGSQLQPYAAVRISGPHVVRLRNAPIAPNEPRRTGRLPLDLMEAHCAEGRDVHRVAPQGVPLLIGAAIGPAESVVENLGPGVALSVVREQPVIAP